MMETDIDAGGARVVITDRVFFPGHGFQHLAEAVAATLKAHGVPLEQFTATLKARYLQP